MAGILSDRAHRQVDQLVREFYALKNRLFQMDVRPIQGQQSFYAKLDGNLDGATQCNWDTSARPSATASIWHADGSGGLVDSGRNVTAVNRMGIAYLAGTVGWVEWRCGEWAFVGDCDLLPDCGSGSGSNLPPSSSDSGSLPSTSMSI